MPRMTPPAALTRLVLIGPAPAASGRDRAAVRRYRLARLRVEGDRMRPGRPRHAHLARVYD